MPTLEQLSLRLIKEFKTVRLHALEDTPSAFGSTYLKESQLSDEDWRKRVTTWNSNSGACYIAMDKSEPCGIIASYFDKADPQRACRDPPSSGQQPRYSRDIASLHKTLNEEHGFTVLHQAASVEGFRVCEKPSLLNRGEEKS